MAGTVSVVIPVKDGAERLEEVLAAVRAQGDVELIVIDSGSHDRSPEISRAAGVELIEIPPEDFGHGRTRNLGAERSSGDLICFLTQDAVPVDGWLGAYRHAFTLDERVGAAFGPHLPHPDTSPMIARELTEFFRGFAPDGRPAWWAAARGSQRARPAAPIPCSLIQWASRTSSRAACFGCSASTCPVVSRSPRYSSK